MKRVYKFKLFQIFFSAYITCTIVTHIISNSTKCNPRLLKIMKVKTITFKLSSNLLFNLTYSSLWKIPKFREISASSLLHRFLPALFCSVSFKCNLMKTKHMVFILLFGLSIVLNRLLFSINGRVAHLTWSTYWEIGVKTMEIKFAEIYVNRK